VFNGGEERDVKRKVRDTCRMREVNRGKRKEGKRGLLE